MHRSENGTESSAKTDSVVSFEPDGFLRKLASKVAHGLIVEEDLIDTNIIDERISICASCEEMDVKNIMCKICGCFLDLKTKSKVNKKKTGGSEITHCPLNKWLDEFSKIGYDTSKTKHQ